MLLWARIAGLALLAAWTPVSPLGVSQVSGEAPLERLTTDSPEYCTHLIERVNQSARLRPLPREAVALSDEGQMMCAHGETRRGILRLRRAMRILLDGQD